MTMSGPVCAIHQENVGIAIVVVVNECAAWTHGFGQPLFSEGPVVVGEVDAGLGGDIAKVDLLGVGGQRQQEQNPPRRHCGTEESQGWVHLDPPAEDTPDASRASPGLTAEAAVFASLAVSAG